MPQVEEDMWHVYNLLAKGDLVTATTFRKVQQLSSTGSSTAQKVKLRLTLEIETIEFDTQTCELRVKGKNMEENEHVKLGQYHSLELALQRNFTLAKPHWDSIYLDRIDTACDIKHSAEIAAVVMQPGLANVCLVRSFWSTARMRGDRTRLLLMLPPMPLTLFCLCLSSPSRSR
jgi:protein pelota